MALMLCFAGRDYRTGEMERGAEREMHMRVTVCRISDSGSGTSIATWRSCPLKEHMMARVGR